MSKLVIVVPASRKHCGRALLLGSDGAARLGPIRVLATASEWAARRHGNETRDWRRPFGHPPVGSYLVGGSLPPGMAPRARRMRRFGALGALVLVPSGGQALEAAKAGRRRFLLHAGPTDRRGRLRPTFGGFRVSDRELASLLRAVNAANAASDPLASVEVVETLDRVSWAEGGPRDRSGRLRPDFAPGRRRAVKRGERRRGPPPFRLGQTVLVTLGFGVGGKSLVASDRPGRRGFVALAMLTLGALGAAGCSDGTDAPSPEPPGGYAHPPCPGDPGEPGDPPDAGDEDGGGDDGGYAASGTGGGGLGYGGAGDPGSGGDDTGDDSSGGAG